MPSLRRTSSSPVVRSSPYSYSSSFNGAQVARGHHGHRRSSGSETATRRVLADIEWWRVTDGQCHDPNSADEQQELEEQTREDQLRNTVAAAMAGGYLLNADNSGGVEHLSLTNSAEASFAVPTAEFAALTLTPPQRQRTLQSSASSSLECTPEPATLTIEGLQLGLSDMDAGLCLFDDCLPPLSALGYERPSLTHAHDTYPGLDMSFCLEDEHQVMLPELLPLSPLLSAASFLN